MSDDNTTRADMSAPSRCSPAAQQAGDAAYPGRSPDALLQHLLEFAEKEASHAMRQWHRTRRGELMTTTDYYSGRHDSMTILIGEIQRLQEKEDNAAKVVDDF